MSGGRAGEKRNTPGPTARLPDAILGRSSPMRFVHIFVAIGIALVANAIEPAWLGLVALMVMLGIYTFIVIKYLNKKHQK